MKSIINRNRKYNNISKLNNYQRRPTLNPDSNNKIDKLLISPEVYSIYKSNKTLHKYINQKLNLLKSHPKAAKNETKKNKSNINSRNTSLNINRTNKTKNIKTKSKINISINIKNKNKNGRNSKQNISLLKKEYNSNKIFSSYNNLPNLLNNKSNNNINNNNINTNNNDNIIKSPMQTKGKLVSNLYQNYSSSMSTGISSSNNNDLFKSCSNFLDNNSFIKYDNNNDSGKKLQDKEYFPFINSNLKINSNEDRNNNTTNNYEIDSSEDNIIDNKIFFKSGGDGSPITFGNSFSYTNSKRSSSTRRILKNNDNENMDNIYNKDDDNVSLLKSQNETLKKELRESNEQITYLKNEIEKLIKKKKMKNIKCSIRINKCPKPMPPVKRYSKNNSCFENHILDTNNYYSNENKCNKKIKTNFKYKK